MSGRNTQSVAKIFAFVLCVLVPDGFVRGALADPGYTVSGVLKPVSPASNSTKPVIVSDSGSILYSGANNKLFLKRQGQADDLEIANSPSLYDMNANGAIAFIEGNVVKRWQSGNVATLYTGSVTFPVESLAPDLLKISGSGDVFFFVEDRSVAPSGKFSIYKNGAELIGGNCTPNCVGIHFDPSQAGYSRLIKDGSESVFYTAQSFVVNSPDTSTSLFDMSGQRVTSWKMLEPDNSSFHHIPMSIWFKGATPVLAATLNGEAKTWVVSGTNKSELYPFLISQYGYSDGEELYVTAEGLFLNGKKVVPFLSGSGEYIEGVILSSRPIGKFVTDQGDALIAFTKFPAGSSTNAVTLGVSCELDDTTRYLQALQSYSCDQYAFKEKGDSCWAPDKVGKMHNKSAGIIGNLGCYLSTLSSAAAYFGVGQSPAGAVDEVMPRTLNDFLKENNGYGGGGLSPGGFRKFVSKALQSTIASYDIERFMPPGGSGQDEVYTKQTARAIKQQICRGNPVVIKTRGSGINDHFLFAYAAVTTEGNPDFKVYDPGARDAVPFFRRLIKYGNIIREYRPIVRNSNRSPASMDIEFHSDGSEQIEIDSTALKARTYQVDRDEYNLEIDSDETGQSFLPVRSLIVKNVLPGETVPFVIIPSSSKRLSYSVLAATMEGKLATLKKEVVDVVEGIPLHVGISAPAQLPLDGSVSISGYTYNFAADPALDRITMNGTYTLAAESNGIDPRVGLSLVFGEVLSQEIPAGAFSRVSNGFLFQSTSPGIQRLKFFDDGRIEIQIKNKPLRGFDPASFPNLIITTGDDQLIGRANSIPRSDASASEPSGVGVPVDLDGRSSTDSDGNSLTYLWRAVSVPQGSSLGTWTASGEQTSIVPDVSGPYAISLVTSDGTVSSAPDVVYFYIDGGDAVPPQSSDNGFIRLTASAPTFEVGQSGLVNLSVLVDPTNGANEYVFKSAFNGIPIALIGEGAAFSASVGPFQAVGEQTFLVELFMQNRALAHQLELSITGFQKRITAIDAELVHETDPGRKDALLAEKAGLQTNIEKTNAEIESNRTKVGADAILRFPVVSSSVR